MLYLSCEDDIWPQLCDLLGVANKNGHGGMFAHRVV